MLNLFYVYISVLVLIPTTSYSSSCDTFRQKKIKTRQISDLQTKIGALKNLTALPGSVADRYPSVVEKLLNMPASITSGRRYLYDELLVKNPNLTTQDAVEKLLEFGDSYTNSIREILTQIPDTKVVGAILRTYSIASSFADELAHTKRKLNHPTPYNTVLGPEIANRVINNDNQAKKLITDFAKANNGLWVELIMALHTPQVIKQGTYAYDLDLDLALDIPGFSAKLANLNAENEHLKNVEFDLIVDNWQPSPEKTNTLTIVEIKSYMTKLSPKRRLNDKKLLDKWLFQLSRQISVMKYLKLDTHHVLWTLGDIGEEARSYLKTSMPNLEVISQ